VKNALISCSWLNFLKVWSLLKTRGDSFRDFNRIAHLAILSYLPVKRRYQALIDYLQGAMNHNSAFKKVI
jgi:hypothetical protein